MSGVLVYNHIGIENEPPATENEEMVGPLEGRRFVGTTLQCQPIRQNDVDENGGERTQGFAVGRVLLATICSMEFRRSVKDTPHFTRFIWVHHGMVRKIPLAYAAVRKFMGRNFNHVSFTQIIFDSF